MSSRPLKRPRTTKEEEISKNTTRELSVLQKLVPSSSTTPIFIVEEHSEALLCLQRSMRRGVLPLSNISMIHYDAHPDLSLPQKLTSDLVFSPNDLLDTLRNTESGIAEWIMPLVFAGHINHIVWVRSPWSTQLKDGTYNMKVGEAVVAHTSLEEKYLVVDCKAPYFANDGMSAAISNLENIQLLSLHVTSNIDTTPTSQHFKHTNTSNATKGLNDTPPESAVCLDICLDYFSTLNPFLEQLKEHIDSTSYNSVIHFCDEFSKHQSTTKSWDTRTWEERLRRAMLEEFIRDEIYMLNHKEMMQHITVRILVPTIHSVRNNTSPFFQLVKVLQNVKKNATLTNATLTNATNDESAAMKMIAATAATAAAPPPTTIDVADLILQYIMWSDLPSHKSTRKEMKIALNNMNTVFENWPTTTLQPSVVTIACSCQDGFIQTDDVKWLIDELLVLLKKSFGKLEILPEQEVIELYQILTRTY